MSEIDGRECARDRFGTVDCLSGGDSWDVQRLATGFSDPRRQPVALKGPHYCAVLESCGHCNTVARIDRRNRARLQSCDVRNSHGFTTAGCVIQPVSARTRGADQP